MGFPLRPRQASSAQETTKQANNPDHSQDCPRVGNTGSTAIGYANSASIEPKFDKAKSRYGTRPDRSRANQACSNGPVVDNTK